MKSFFVVGLLLALSAGGFAQRGGRMGGVRPQPSTFIGVGSEIPFRTYGSPSGFGNVVFPGTGTPPPFTTSFPSTTFIERFGDVIAGKPYTGVRGGFRQRRYSRGGFFGPTVWPVVVGGLPYDYGYDQPAPTFVAPPQQAAPPVTINQYFGADTVTPAVHEYPQSGESSPGSGVQIYRAPSPQPAGAPSGEDQVLFFIALKDSSIYTAVAYWVEDGTLHYITPQGRHNQVSLALVDRNISTRLNAGRAVDFRLPPS